MAGPLCQCSALLGVATKPQGGAQAQSCGWTSHYLRQGSAASLCLCSLLAGQWAPYLARLDNTGSINAWSTDRSNAWIQVRGALCLEAPLGPLQGRAHAEGLMDGQCLPSYILLFPLPSEGEHYDPNGSCSGQVAAGLTPYPSSVQQWSLMVQLQHWIVQKSPKDQGGIAHLSKQLSLAHSQLSADLHPYEQLF